MAPLWPGCRVLVHNAAGGVGLACLALATDSGAEIWGRAGRAKHEVLRNWGCHHPLDSRSDEWPDQKVDVVLDPIGGASWGRALNSLRVGGRLVVYGFSASTQGSGPAWWGMTRAAAAVPWLRFNPVELMNRNLGVLGVNMGHVWEEAERVGQWLVSCNSFIAERGIKPVVHAEVPFERAAEAHAMLESRDTVGKVVLVP
jgi:synaptic vesicle membrane protein VAT-1